MKKTIFALALIALFNLSAKADPEKKTHEIQIIYVHGAQQYTIENKKQFVEDIFKIHKYLFK